VDDALRAEALRELEAAKRTAAAHGSGGGGRPLPLVDDPRCPRCSLQPICLPDEVNHQRRAALTVEGRAAEPPSPRRIWPPRDDGVHVVAQTDGVRIGVRGSALRFTDRDGATVRDMPIASLESLAVVGHVQVSTQAVHVLADHGAPVVFMTSAGRCVAWIDSPGPTSAALKSRQAHRFAETSPRLALSRAVVSAKIANQRTLLMRNAPELPRDALDELARQARDAAEAPGLDALLGHEGQAAAVYFRWFPAMIRDESLRARFDMHGRRRRPPPDPVNALLSFAYSMLTHECVSALRTASLEPAIGAYHTTRPGRPALALDLMEPFRPIIADSVAVSLINRGEVGPGHFLDTAAGCALTDHGRRAFFDAWGRRMATEVTHPVFDYRLSYRRMLMLHARLIAAWLLDEVPTLAFLTTR
jgi:CRISPR-associated endonuclease Cas1